MNLSVLPCFRFVVAEADCLSLVCMLEYALLLDITITDQITFCPSPEVQNQLQNQIKSAVLRKSQNKTVTVRI